MSYPHLKQIMLLPGRDIRNWSAGTTPLCLHAQPANEIAFVSKPALIASQSMLQDMDRTPRYITETISSLPKASACVTYIATDLLTMRNWLSRIGDSGSSVEIRFAHIQSNYSDGHRMPYDFCAGDPISIAAKAPVTEPDFPDDARARTKIGRIYHFTGWSGRRDLNPRPHDPKSWTLPNCATPR